MMMMMMMMMIINDDDDDDNDTHRYCSSRRNKSIPAETNLENKLTPSPYSIQLASIRLSAVMQTTINMIRYVVYLVMLDLVPQVAVDSDHLEAVMR